MEEIFRQRLREEIRHSGLTKKEIAEKIGVSPEMITQYCTTLKFPSLKAFYQLCKALDVYPNYHLSLEE